MSGPGEWGEFIAACAGVGAVSLFFIAIELGLMLNTMDNDKDPSGGKEDKK